MPVVLGADLGTTTITALALDALSGDVLACCTRPSAAALCAPADRARGLSEWDPGRIAEIACACLRDVADALGARRGELAGLGITGQQHGGVIVDAALRPRTPFINWQDRRAEQVDPRTGTPWLHQALDRAGADAPRQTGCRLAAGYLAVTLFVLKETGTLPAGTACSLMDYFGALLTGRPPVTDPTCAASSGALRLLANDWDADLLAALGLPREMFPEVRPSGDRLGGLTPAMAEATGLPVGLPVFVGIGDNQASFLGSVADRGDTVLLNVGTGAQVAVYTDHFEHDPLLEVRPFPRGGYLRVSAGLCGGGTYAVLERFFRAVGAELFGVAADESLYRKMTDLAARVPPGAEGLRCVPYFTGTRAQPERRAGFDGLSAQNFTPAHLTRALLEGMAASFRDGYEQVARQEGRRNRLAGAGNGLRRNALLRRLAAEAFGMPLLLPLQREEAAFGAALLASVGAGIYPDLAAAGRLIRYTDAAGGEH